MLNAVMLNNINDDICEINEAQTG